jgi:putative nucleotidyltransferase with HDIG domain
VAAAGSGALTPALARELARAAGDARSAEYVTALRIYRPDGSALFPAGAPPAPDSVHRALNADDLVRSASADTITAYSPIFVRSEQVYVVALDFAAGQLNVGFANERDTVFKIVGAVTLVIFCSLVTLAAGASRELERRRREAAASFVDTLKLMAETVDLRDPYTAGHSQRVARYSRLIATAMKLSATDVDTIENGALLHDIGKIAIPDDVLFKPAALDARERAIIGTHPVVGAKLLGNIPAMSEIVPCVKHHHERIDGRGYPGGLCGDAIPLGARIIAVADTFDAMTTDRPYRRALDFERAAEELRRVAGVQLDRAAVAAFLELLAAGRIAPPATAPNGEALFGRKSEIEMISQ